MSIIFNAKKDQKFVHFISVGDVGISILTYWFLAPKWSISGSDLSVGKISCDLKNDGVKVKIGHKKANLEPKTAPLLRLSAQF